MSTFIKTTCILCRENAEYRDYLARRLKHFSCQKCKHYIIKNKAEQHIATAQHLRDQFSAYAAAVPTDLVTLLTFDQARPGVDAEYLPLHEALHR